MTKEEAAPKLGLPELGVIEGYFGRPWSFEERRAVVSLLAPHGYGFFHYAPKADAFLRRRWQEPYPDDAYQDLADFAAQCRAHGVRFGIGFSPFGAGEEFDPAARNAFETKLKQLTALGLDDLGVFFDDMPVTKSDIAARQAEVLACARAVAPDVRLIMCPSFYSDDRVLDRVFGARPQNYLRDLGKALAPDVQMYWTGEEVCAKEISPGHLQRVADEIGRKPFLWDNYPVNDGPRMSQHLHLRAFTGRPAAIGAHVAAHAINPAMQPILSCIPALTLIDSYRRGDDYRYMQAFRDAARTIAGPEIADMLEAALYSFDDGGLARLSAEQKDKARARWSKIDHAIAREIIGWLDGAYTTAVEEVQTQ